MTWSAGKYGPPNLDSIESIERAEIIIGLALLELSQIAENNDICTEYAVVTALLHIEHSRGTLTKEIVSEDYPNWFTDRTLGEPPRMSHTPPAMSHTPTAPT